jgi:hypothetical protein
MRTNLLIIIVCIILSGVSVVSHLRTGIRSLPPDLDFSNFTNLAVLRYAGAPKSNPTVDPTMNGLVIKIPLIETNLHVGAL